MRIQRKCKVCGEKFIAIKVTQFYCRRKCFKKDYYNRTKDKSQEKEDHPVYPTKTCSFCQIRSQLNFDPLHSPEAFNAWGCPHCGATNKLVWEYQHNSNSYQIISNILVSFQFNQSGATFQHQYQTYHLPIMRLGQGDPSVLTMTCEPLKKMEDIQKKDRKKLLFS